MAARTLAQLQSAVENLGLGVDLATPQAEWLNDEYRNLAGMRRWRWLEGRFTFVTVAGTAAYTPTPTDLRSLDKVRLADSAGNSIWVDWRDPQHVQDLVHQYNQVSDQGAPQFWSTYAGQIYFYAIPDNVYTATVDYTKNITPMVSAGDTPALLPEAYDDIIVWGAASRAFVRQNNWLMRDFAIQQKQQLINQMEAEYSKDQTQRSGEIQWTGIWDGADPWH